MTTISNDEVLPAQADTPHVGDKPASEAADAKARKKREKVRSAWISFVGRIVAQLVGAVATIALGLVVVQHYGVGTGRSDATDPPARVDVRPTTKRIAGGRPTLVVLPFANFSTDAGLEPFVDGLTESLIAELTRVTRSLGEGDNLRVISRTTSMHYKGSRKPLREIARELGVDLVVEGSVTPFEGRIRVVAQLVDALSDDHIWAQTYERGLGDVLEVQGTVARVIAQDVKLAAPHLPSRSKSSPDHAPVAFNGRLLTGR